MNILPFPRQVDVIAHLVEGNSIRSIERLLCVHRDTIIRLAVRVGTGCGVLHDRIVTDIRAPVVETDEMWTFVRKKQARLADDDPPDFGDQFVFVSIDADTKLVITHLVGKRTLACAKDHMADLRSRIIGRPQITTDGFAPYVEAVEYAFGADIDYAMIVGKDDQAGGAGHI
jgi:IS1 family transposase